MLEKKLEENLRKGIESLGGISYKFTSPGNVGVPDRLVLLGGRVVFVELKTDRGRLSRMQVRQLQRIRSREVAAVVVYGASGLSDFLSDLSAGGGLEEVYR